MQNAMQEYISKQQQIFRSAAQIFPLISNFTLLTPAVADKVEEWQATEDHCSFKFKGFTVSLCIDEKVENKHVKITGDGGTVPMDFAFWIQLHQVSEGDTRIRLVLHAELNMMMRMMIGGKIQEAMDKMAEQIAAALNGAPI